MKIRATVLAFVVFLVVAGIATGATQDKGRRIAGPICVSLDTGVVRAVAEKPFQACRAGEIRRYGLYVKSSVTKKVIIIKGKAGPRGQVGPAGPGGSAGAIGTAGPAGPAGPQGGGGPQGPAGNVTVTQLTGDQKNCVKISGSDGSSGVICGTAGAKGDTGAPGKDGRDGKDGICPIPCQDNGKCKDAKPS
jgi:hypothetical protein